MNFWLQKVLLKVKNCRGSVGRHWVRGMGVRGREVSKVNLMLYAGVTLKMGHSHQRRRLRRKRKSWEGDSELSFGHASMEVFVGLSATWSCLQVC